MNWKKLSELLYPDTKMSIQDLLKKYPKRVLAEDTEVTRFAPSPTGYLHIGHLSQTLLDTFIAGKNGIFYYRLEDTDLKRLNIEAKTLIFKLLAQFDIKANEGYMIGGNFGPYAQSERVDIYNVFAKELVRIGRARPCFCGENESKQDVEERRLELMQKTNDLKYIDPCFSLNLEEIEQKINNGEKWALRFISKGNEQNTFEFTDEIKGKRILHENTGDAILIKSNGIPVYAFAHVVDDTLMGTTIVVRGEDWWSSLPLHLELFDAFCLPRTKYAHTPNIMINDKLTGNKRKISKRKDPEADIRYFLKKGYPIFAIKDYLANLINSNFEIWRAQNPKLDIMQFSFELKNVGTSNPFFDEVKLQDISKNYISTLTNTEVYAQCLEYANEFDKVLKNELTRNKDKWLAIFNIDRDIPNPRKDLAHYSQVSTYFDYFLPAFKPVQLSEISDEKLKHLIGLNECKRFINNFIKNYKPFKDNSQWFDYLKHAALANGFAENKVYKAEQEKYIGSISDAAMVIRFLITKKIETPTLFSIMSILGPHECIKRLGIFD